MAFQQFAKMVSALGQTTKTNDKLGVLKAYLTTAPDADKVWTIALFTGRRPRRMVSGSLMGSWCMEITGLPGWLFTECYGLAGDLSETIALLLPPANIPVSEAVPAGASTTLSQILEQFTQLHTASEADKKTAILGYWQQFTTAERFVFNKLMSANFRIGVSANLLIQAIAACHGLTVAEVAHRISGNWNPATTTYTHLLFANTAATDNSKPFPFYLAYPLENDCASLGNPTNWMAEWKWDGIRGQVIKRKGEGFIWSRGEELITEKFPEFERLFEWLPDGTCLDGEIIALPKDFETLAELKPAAFSALQTRIGRKNLTKKILQEVPVGFLAYDLLEWQGNDVRQQPLLQRRQWLNELFGECSTPAFRLSEKIAFESWEQLATIRTNARNEGAEGLMLKRKASEYGTGRRRGDWWKWKIEPLTIDAVMIYAQRGSGRRSNLYTDYTFAVRDGERLVPFTKAYSGLTDKEFAQVDAFVKKNSLEKFGPVRTVKPELVFEIGFEGISESKRHKSGVALRFPRMLRWRHDKKPEDINTLDELKNLLHWYNSTPRGL
ncbi:MAG: ATP-dependent DNA ligase [Bacteroidetes bacterium]|nr:MAG: ATP-dependent DNA ligase [Bacteroidota bacterium]